MQPAGGLFQPRLPEYAVKCSFRDISAMERYCYAPLLCGMFVIVVRTVYGHQLPSIGKNELLYLFCGHVLSSFALSDVIIARIIRIVKRLQTKSTEDPCFFHALFLFSVFQLRHLLFSRIGFAVFAFALYKSENTSPIFPSIKSTPPRSRAGAPRLMTTMCSPPK